MKSERGFTLIELLTVTAIIGIIAALGLTSFYVYRGDAAYAVAERTVADGITALEASLSQPDQALPDVPGFSQVTQGALTDPSARDILPGMMIPRKMKFRLSYDPACLDASCEQASLQANHCAGQEYVRWVRYGDGLSIRLEHLAGTGCS